MPNSQNIIIESIGTYLPSNAISTDEVLQGCTNSIRFPLEKITGIKTRRIAGQGEFSFNLAKKAVADCLVNSQYSANDIDLLICCNISRYDEVNRVSFEPGTSIRLKRDFNFSNALVFDIANACAGMFTGIYIVNALIKTGAIRRGMVVSGEYITCLMQTAQKDIKSFMDTRLACLTLGDAGAALILEAASDQHTGFCEMDLQTFGRFSKYCTATVTEQNGMVMYTESLNLTNAAVQRGARHALNALQRAQWSPEDFQHLIMHQTSTMTLNSARNEINRVLKREVCHGGNTINNLEQRGNTASTAHFVALADYIRNNKIQSGDKVIFSIAASGLTIGTALYVFDDLPDRLRRKDSSQIAGQNCEPANRLSTVKNARVLGIRIESIGTIPQDTTGKKDALELLQRAARCCLTKSTYVCSDVELLLYCGVYRNDYLMEPAFATLLAGALDMNADSSAHEQGKTLAFDIFNGSMGFLNACYVAQQMIAGNTCDTVMIAAAEIENNAALFPDELLGICETASAVILDAHPTKTKGFGLFLFRDHTEHLSAYTTYCTLRDRRPHLHTEKAAQLEELYLQCIGSAVWELLQSEQFEPGQITLVFPPQISSQFISCLRGALNLPGARFVDIAEEGPDFFTSSLPCGLEYAYAKGLIKPGDTGLLIAVGSGLQVGCAVYHF